MQKPTKALVTVEIGHMIGNEAKVHTITKRNKKTVSVLVSLVQTKVFYNARQKQQFVTNATDNVFFPQYVET